MAGRKRLNVTDGKAIHTLYLSYDGMTDPLGQSQVIPYLAGLSEKQIRFTLISFEKPDAFQRSGETIQALLQTHGIHWIPLTYTKRPPVLSTIYDAWKLRHAVRQIMRDDPAQIVHCRSYITALVGKWAKRTYGIKFLFDMRGLWADERVDGKLWNLDHPVYQAVYRFFKKKELEFLHSADHTVSLTEAAKREILSWPALQGKHIPLTVIPCCVDLGLFNPERVTPERLASWRDRLGLQANDFVVTYVGSIGTWYLLDEMLRFFKKLLTVKPQAKFLFITRHEHARIREAARELGITGSLIIQPAERDEVPELIRLGQLSVFFILPAYSKMASSPTKQGEIMAMGIPVVCNSGVGDTDEIVKRYQSGYLVENDDLDAVIRRIGSNEPVFSEAGIIAGAKDYFSLESGVARYAAIYREMLT